MIEFVKSSNSSRLISRYFLTVLKFSPRSSTIRWIDRCSQHLKKDGFFRKWSYEVQFCSPSLSWFLCFYHDAKVGLILKFHCTLDSIFTASLIPILLYYWFHFHCTHVANFTVWVDSVYSTHRCITCTGARCAPRRWTRCTFSGAQCSPQIIR